MHIIQRTIDNVSDYLTYHCFGNITWEKEKVNATKFDVSDANEIIDMIEHYGNLSSCVEFKVVPHSYRILYNENFIAEVVHYEQDFIKVSLCKNLQQAWAYDIDSGEKVIALLKKVFDMDCKLVEIGDL